MPGADHGGGLRTGGPSREKGGRPQGDLGKVLIVGGSEGYTGAPYLTASAAVRSGCGLVFLGVPERIWQVEASKCVCAMPFPLPDNMESSGPTHWSRSKRNWLAVRCWRWDRAWDGARG
ncbi:MAG: NAD(P)H-hydrate dehydratase [Dysosmobacter sp.]